MSSTKDDAKKQVGLTKSERYAMLALRRESIEEVARVLGESPKRISNTLSELRKNFRIRHKIAEHLGLTYEQCWGETEPSEEQLRAMGGRGPHLRLAETESARPAG